MCQNLDFVSYSSILSSVLMIYLMLYDFKFPEKNVFKNHNIVK